MRPAGSTVTAATYVDRDYRAERLLADVGLTPYQSKILVALVAHDGPADSATIAALSGVPRTSVYKAAATLYVIGLVTVSTRGPGGVGTAARWEAAPWQVTCQRLYKHLERNYTVRARSVDRLDANR